MKKIKIFSLFLAAMIISTFLYAQDSGKEQLIVPLSDPGKPYKINVGLTTGSISITGYDGKDIQIDAETTGNKNRSEEDKGNSGGMRRISSHSLSVTAEEKNNRINIGTDRPNLNIHLSIRIPKGASEIKVETVNDGDIDVSNTGGEMEITNVNGSIRLKNVSLSYNVPSTILSRQKAIKGLRATVGVQNIATITGYLGYDPEVGSYVGRDASSGNQAIGLDFGRYPLTPIYTFNLSVNF